MNDCAICQNEVNLLSAARALWHVFRLFCVILCVLCSLVGISFAEGNVEVSNLLSVAESVDCQNLLQKNNVNVQPRKSWVKYATHVTGFVLGSANGVVLTTTGGAMQIMSPAFAKWLPLYNEIANVASTSSGVNWIYSGVRKKLIDGIALGGIAAQSVQAGVEHGVPAGALTMAVTVGLTYWFPNKYFHSIMKGLPKIMPPTAQKIFAHPVGQGFIGISMIVVLEQVLEKAQHLAWVLPSLFSYNDLTIPTSPNSFEYQNAFMTGSIDIIEPRRIFQA